MKKLLLSLMFVFSVNANAALLSIETDKSIYNVGDTILATVNIDTNELYNNSVATIIGGYNISVAFDNLLASFIDGSDTYGTFLGQAVYEPFPGLVFSPLVTISSDNVNIQQNMEPGSTQPVNGGMVELFSIELIANTIGSGILDVVSNSSIAMLTDFWGNEIPSVTTQSASFSVEATSVPAPSTGVLALLACFGMAVSRVKARR